MPLLIRARPPDTGATRTAFLPGSLAALLIAGLLSIGPSGPAYADDDGERARAALQAGQIRPLRQVLDIVDRQWRGEVIDIELDREDGQWIYEVKLLSPQGSVIKLEYDAQRGTLLKAKGRGVADARKEP